MRHALRRHPESLSVPATQVDVEVVRAAGALVLTYRLAGDLDPLRLPPVVASGRREELWRHTCFEAFLRATGDGAYYEFNFSPSTQWAAYRFSGYRTGMQVAARIAAPIIAVEQGGGRYTLRATLALDDVPDLPRATPWRLGLSALLEDADGRMSYWALAHPPGKPDFHHADGFACELPSNVP
jgi:hypothetical protein